MNKSEIIERIERNEDAIVRLDNLGLAHSETDFWRRMDLVEYHKTRIKRWQKRLEEIS